MIQFQVDDMSCGHCANAIYQAVELADSKAKVEVDLGSHLVKIDGEVDPLKMEQAIREAGFTPVLKRT